MKTKACWGIYEPFWVMAILQNLSLLSPLIVLINSLPKSGSTGPSAAAISFTLQSVHVNRQLGFRPVVGDYTLLFMTEAV